MSATLILRQNCHPEAKGRGTFTDQQGSLAALGMAPFGV